MVTLLLGPYGHGKSTYIIDKIKADYENGVRSFLIVPEQQTVVAERQLTEALPPKAQLYTEATNLTRLANSVFRKTGGLRYNYVTKSGQNLIMYRTICEVRDLLKQYRIPKGREKSCIKLFLQAIGELKSYGVEISQLENAMCELESTDLKARISDIITVWSTYSKILGELYDDPYDDLLMLEKKLGECAFFKGANVYIDSFYGFTKGQLNVIERIIDGASNVTIALDCPASADTGTMQYVKIASTRDKLLNMCKRLGVQVEKLSFEVDYKHGSQEIAHICKNLWDFSANAIPSQGDITLALASDEFEACQFVCAKIHSLLHQGARFGDIAIIARNTATYQGIIDFCLDKFDIPYYFSVPSKLMTKPVIKMVFSALSAIGSWRSEDVVCYAKCGYTDIGTEELCSFEKYVYKWSIYGKKFKNEDYWNANPDGYLQGMTEGQILELEKIQKTKNAILKSLSILEKPFMLREDVRACCVAVYEFLEAHKIREKLNAEIKSETPENAQELSQVWSALVGALEMIVNICEDTVCDIDTFITLLNYALMDARVGTIPSGEDRVIIADASLVRAKNIKHVFVLGANEGVFPAVVGDDSFFSDSDKIALETVEIDLSARTDERSDDELLFFKNSIAVSSDTATVIALKSGLAGQKMEPSLGFSRIKALIKDASAVDISAIPPVDMLYTEQVACEMMGAISPEARIAISELSGKAEPQADFKNENDTVSTEVAKELFGKRLYLSKSKIESFAKCRLDYYCKYVLGLRDNEKFKFTHNDIGTLIHAIFEHFLKLDKENRRDYTDEEILEIVTKLTDDYTQQVCGVRAISNKMKHFFTRLKGTVCVFVSSLLEEMKASKFTPEFFELSIIGDGSSAPLPLELDVDGENKIVMTGIADRIDICRSDDTTYVKIFDYKTGSYAFSPAALDKGLDTQMLIYLMALCNMKESEFKNKVLQWTEKIEPAGIVYLTYKINKTDLKNEVDLSSDEAMENEIKATGDKVSRSGLELDLPMLEPTNEKYKLSAKATVDSEQFDQLFNIVKDAITAIGIDMLSGNAQAEPLAKENPCRYCKNGAICRRRTV